MDKLDVVLVTGAGVSASAGLPLFRDENGLWSDEEFLKMSFSNRYGNYLEQLIPRWLELFDQASKANPTLFHLAAAQAGWKVITQNVDGLHSRAGSAEVLEVHGTLSRWTDLKGRNPFLLSERTITNKDRVRPDMVLFGEKIKHGKLAEDWIKKADTVVFVGTSGNVYPVADWVSLAKRSVLVDPKPWQENVFDLHIPLKSDTWAIAGLPLY